MKGNYFATGVSRSEQATLGKYYGAAMDAETDRMIKLVDAMNRTRNSDLSYQMNLEELQRRRDDAQRKKDEDARLNQLTGALQGLTDPNQSPEEQRAALADFRMDNTGLFKSAGATQLYNAANAKITADAAVKAKEVAKAEKEIHKNMLLYGNNLDKLQTEFAKGGYTDQEKEAFEIAKYKIEEAQTQKRAQQDFARASGKVAQMGKRTQETDTLLGNIITDADREMAKKPEGEGGLTPEEKSTLGMVNLYLDGTSDSAAKNMRKLKIALARQEGQSISGIEDYLKEEGLTTAEQLLARVELNNEREKEQYAAYKFQIDYGQIPIQPQAPQQNNTSNSYLDSLYNQ